MTINRYSCDGTNTTALSNANTGGLVTTGAGCTNTFSTGRFSEGTASWKSTVVASVQNQIRITSNAASTQMAARFKVNFEVFPNTTGTAVQKQFYQLRSTAGRVLAVALSVGRQVVLQNTAGGAQVSTGVTLSLNTWYRIEIVVTVLTTTTGIYSVAVYADNATSPIAAAITGSAYNLNTTAVNGADVCEATTGVGAMTVYFDDIAFSDGGVAEIGVAAKGSTATAQVASAGAGTKKASGGSQVAAQIAAQGAGVKKASGGSTAECRTDTAGVGVKRSSAGAEIATAVSTAGAGLRRALSGSQVAVQTAAAGTGSKVGAGGSAAVAEVVSQGLGSVAVPNGGGSTVEVAVIPAGAGTKITAGGSAAPAAVAVAGAGRKVVAGSTQVVVQVADEGDGSMVGLGDGLVSVVVSATGSGRHITTGGTETTVTVMAIGSGHPGGERRDITVTIGTPVSAVPFHVGAAVNWQPAVGTGISHQPLTVGSPH